MLLYTRTATPKAPKRRSRAGCNYCKEKKKKCDEARPICSRCQEHGQDCRYEPVKPRVRRRIEPDNGLVLRTAASSKAVKRELSDVSSDSAAEEWHSAAGHGDGGSYHETTSVIDFSDELGDLPFEVDALESVGLDPVVGGFEAIVGGFDLGAIDCSPAQDDVEEVARKVDARPASNPSLALMAPFNLPSPTVEFCQPAFYEFSRDPGRRALMDHFCNTLSHLIVLREDEGNPFQQLVLPLSHNSQAVSGAIYALACAHLEVRGVQGGERSLYYHNQSIQGLARLIEQGDGVNKNELLAAIMLLVYYEVRGRSNLVDGHLKGAMAIMSSSSKAPTDTTTVFLERAFRFYDVIAALSFGTAPLSSCPSSGGFTQFAPLDSHGAASAHDSVDALLGMATSLWPVIHRLSGLLSLKHALEDAVVRGELATATVMRAEFDSTCAAIEVALHEWEPILPHGYYADGDVSEETAAECRGLHSIVNSALAYRHSAVVYLYRSVYGCSRRHAVVQHHTRISLAHCEATVSHAGPMGSLLWPLFVAACEAATPEDRELAKRSFAGVERRQGMKNIERAWRVVQEVWRRADDGEDKFDLEATDDEDDEELLLGEKIRLGRRKGDLWRRVSQDLGMTIVLG